MCMIMFWLQEFKLAQFHCYGRFLSRQTGKDVRLLSVAEYDLEGFKKVYLPTGLDDPSAVNVVSMKVIT